MVDVSDGTAMDASRLYADYLQFCAGEPPQRTAAELEAAAAALDLSHAAATWEHFWCKLDPGWFRGKQAEHPFNHELQVNAVYRAFHRGLLEHHSRMPRG